MADALLEVANLTIGTLARSKGEGKRKILVNDVSFSLARGKVLGLISAVKTADGQSHQMADVWFSQTSTTSTVPLSRKPPVSLSELLAAPSAGLPCRGRRSICPCCSGCQGRRHGPGLACQQLRRRLRRAGAAQTEHADLTDRRSAAGTRAWPTMAHRVCGDRGDAMTQGEIVFQDGAGYEQMMGKWSRLAGDVFLDWLTPADRLRWVDVGCGNGAFTELIVDRCDPARVQGIDASEAQLAFARTRPRPDHPEMRPR